MAIPAEMLQDLEIERMDVARRPPDWRDPAAVEDLRAIGGDWAAALTTAVLAVPSAVIPIETNFPLNPFSASLLVTIERLDRYVGVKDPRLTENRPHAEAEMIL